MIIVEGVDHVGKTTLVDAIVERLRPHLGTHVRLLERDELVQKWSQLPPEFDYFQSYLLATEYCKPVIADRFCVSELAYGPVYRGHVDPRFDSHAQRQVARALNRRNAIHVRVHAGWKIVEARLKKNPDDLVKHQDHFRALTHQFDSTFLHNLALGEHGTWWMPTPMGKWRPRPGLSTSEGGLTRTAVYTDWIVQTWLTRQERARQFEAMDTESWGSLRPKVLLVGEQVNLNGDLNRSYGGMPFSGVGPSSRMLTKLLDAGGVPEGDIHVVNAYRINGNRMNADLIPFLNPAVIIPLGRAAEDVIRVLGFGQLVTPGQFPHPQWISRFRSKEFHQFGQRLASAMRHGGS